MAKGVTIDFTANLARFSSGLDKATNDLGKFQSNAKRRSNDLKKAFGGLAALVGGIGFTHLIKSSLDAADEMQKMSQRIGASTEALSEYKHVADLTGVSFRTLTMGWQRMTRRISEAAQDTGEAKNALKELGISAKELNKLAPEQQFEVLADAMAKVTSQSDKVRLSMKLFDSEGVSLLQTMQGGAEAIREMREEAQALGLTVSQDFADSAAAANDAITRMGATSKALALTLAKTLAPTIESIAVWLQENIPDAVNTAAGAFNWLQQKISEVGAGWSAMLADAENNLADVADFFGADEIAQSFRNAGNAYADSAKIFADGAEYYRSARVEANTLQKSLEAGISFNQFYNQAISESYEIEKKLKGSKKGLTDAQKELNKSLKESQSVYDSTRTPLEKYNIELEKLNNLRTSLKGTSGAIDDDTYLRKIDKLQNDLKQSSGLQSVVDKVDVNAPLVRQLETLQQLKEAFPEYTDIIMEEEMNIHEKMDGMTEDLVENAEIAKEAWEDLGLTFASAFEDAIVNGEDLSSVLKGLEQDIIRMITRSLVTQPLGNAIGGMFSGGGVGSWLGGLFGGFRAEGGPVTAGKSYIVGEKRAELFTPAQNGYISPSTAGGGVNVTMNISTPDANSFRRSEGQLGAQAAMAINNAGRYL
ncbi:MAG: hypothetical protein GY750_03380 [Lentisphaerae bacterium]|nr:hypothetical protein [Lentisphaerota bacterium]